MKILVTSFVLSTLISCNLFGQLNKAQVQSSLEKAGIKISEITQVGLFNLPRGGKDGEITGKASSTLDVAGLVVNLTDCCLEVITPYTVYNSKNRANSSFKQLRLFPYSSIIFLYAIPVVNDDWSRGGAILNVILTP